jgi:NhaA family Na+:H+ antiporter
VTHWRNPDGNLELVMFGDYECPHTAAGWRTAGQLQERFGERLRFGWRHYPVRRAHPHAQAAAEAAEAAGAQDRFWELHERLFDHQDALAADDLIEHARAVGLDAERVAAELRAHAHADAVEADKRAGREIGLSRTPTFVVGGRRWDGFYDVETLTELLEAGA